MTRRTVALEQANKELARDDSEAADRKLPEAIEHCKNAWQKAQEAAT